LANHQPEVANARGRNRCFNFRCANGCDGQGGNGDPSATSWTFTLTPDTPRTVNCTSA
jgi:hypothetical protein